MKHYTLFSHGCAKVSRFEDEGFEQYPYPAVKKVTIPDGVTVVFYIPPGTIFSAASGKKLYDRIRNQQGLDQMGTQQLVQIIRGSMNASCTQQDHSNTGQIFWVGQTTTEDYPMICTATQNTDYAYNYRLRGMKPTDDARYREVDWGLYAAGLGGGGGGGGVVPLAEGQTSTLQAMLDAAKQHAAGNEATVHCIFCRIEWFKKEEVLKLAGPSMRTQKLNFVKLNFT